MKYAEQLKVLRGRIPIGISVGRELLEKFQGDVEKTEQHFQDHLTDLLVQQENVTSVSARRHLVHHQFDIERARESVVQEQLTLTERIFRAANSSELALERLISAIAQDELQLNDWFSVFSERDLEKLQPSQFVVMAIWSWVTYAEYEGFVVALELDYTAQVIEHISRSLRLDSVSRFIQHAMERKRAVRNGVEGGKSDATDVIYNLLQADEQFRVCERGFQQNRNALIEALVDYTRQRVDDFPK